MSYEIVHLDGMERALAKQAKRDDDARRLALGEIGKFQLKRENSFSGSLPMHKFKIVAMGGKPFILNEK